MPTAFSVPELQAIPFFSAIEEDDAAVLLDRHRLVEVMPGQTLVMEADWGENLMVVISGLAKVRPHSAVPIPRSGCCAGANFRWMSQSGVPSPLD